MTSSVICPRGSTFCTGITPWNSVGEGQSAVNGIPILDKVLVYSMLMLEPLSMSTFESLHPPINGPISRGVLPGLVMYSAWSSYPKEMVCSD